MNTPEDRVHCHGKELLLDGHHLADMVSEEAAEVVAICLNRGGSQHMSSDEAAKVGRFFA